MCCFLSSFGWQPTNLKRHFKEAEVYLLRFQQCLTRAMTLIKMYLVGTFRAIHTDVQKRMAETVSDRFAVPSPSINDCLGFIFSGRAPPTLYEIPIHGALA